MQLHMFSLRDSKADTFHSPICCQTYGEAERTFVMMQQDNNPNNLIAKFPEDYELFHVGTWDQSTGTIIPLEKPKSVAVGSRSHKQ